MRGDECEMARLENHEPGVHERSEMIRWVTALARIGLVVAAIAATVLMIAFAQTSEPAIESVPTEAEEVNASPTDDDMSDETDPPSRSAIPAEVEAEFQRLFTQHRSELLDDRAAYIDRWLSVTAIVLTFFGIVVAIAGVLGFRRFREIETEARKSVDTAKKHETAAKAIRERIEKLLSESEADAQSIRSITAEAADNDPAQANLTIENVHANPNALLTDKGIASAVSLQQQGKTDEAIKKWRALAHITEGSDNDFAARAWFSVGYLLKDKDLESCVSANDAAIRLNPDFAEAYVNRGSAKSELNRHEDAIADHNEAIRLKPDFADAYTGRGVAKDLLGRPEDAIADYDAAIRLKPDLDVTYFNRGISKSKLNQPEDAIADYDTAIHLNPDYVEAYVNRGISKSTLNRHEDAIADYDTAIHLNPDFAEAYVNRGSAKSKLNRHEDAIADYDAAIRLNPDFAEAYVNRGISKSKLNRHEDAIADYDAAIRLKPNLADAYTGRGVAKDSLGRPEDAIADYDAAIRLKPDLDVTYFTRGSAKSKLNQHEDAIADYDAAIRLNPDSAEAYFNRGNTKSKLNRHEDAIADYDTAIRLNPDFAKAYVNRGNMKIVLGLKDAARNDFEIALEMAQKAGDVDVLAAAKQSLRDLDDAEGS